MPKVSYNVVVKGRVQGVSFRASMWEVAVRHGVVGWVANRTDGAVEAVVQGEDAAVQSVIEWAKKGPPGAEVASVTWRKLEEYPAQAAFQVFG